MDARSLTRLKGAHPDLVRLMTEAHKTTPIDFRLTEVWRTPERQAELKKAGASETLNSRHLTGHAADVVCLVGKEVRWDWPLYVKLSKHIKAVAKKLDIAITWGGDWKNLRDGPHYELDWTTYPKAKI